MLIDIAFSGESTRPSRVRYPLHRVLPRIPVSLVCTSVSPVVVVYHWHDGRPIIHTSPVCSCSTLLLPSRERGYLGGLVAVKKPPGGWKWFAGVLELTEDGLEQLRLLADGRKDLRGLKLVARRADHRPASRQQLELKGVEPLEQLPAPLDLIGFAHTLWDRFFPILQKPSIAHAGPAEPSWDSPEAEIPTGE